MIVRPPPDLRCRGTDIPEGAGATTGNTDYQAILSGNYQNTGTMVLSHEVDDSTVGACPTIALRTCSLTYSHRSLHPAVRAQHGHM
jgi:hypothetical protein